MRDQLQDVTKIFSSSVAFAALKKDGSVVTWGMPRGGGDSRKVQAQLSEVLEIYSTDYAFATDAKPPRGLLGRYGARRRGAQFTGR